jgi:hypothetical protein
MSRRYSPEELAANAQKLGHVRELWERCRAVYIAREQAVDALGPVPLTDPAWNAAHVAMIEAEVEMTRLQGIQMCLGSNDTAACCFQDFQTKEGTLAYVVLPPEWLDAAEESIRRGDHMPRRPAGAGGASGDGGGISSRVLRRLTAFFK